MFKWFCTIFSLGAPEEKGIIVSFSPLLFKAHACTGEYHVTICIATSVRTFWTLLYNQKRSSQTDYVGPLWKKIQDLSEREKEEQLSLAEH